MKCAVDWCRKEGLEESRGMCVLHFKARAGLFPARWKNYRRPLCSAEGCRDEHMARGFCKRHYQRVWKRERRGA